MCSLGDTTHTHAPYKPTTEQSADTTEVHVGKPMSFIGVTYRRRNDKHSLITRAHGTVNDSVYVLGSGAYYTACRRLAGLKGVFSRQLSWSLFLSGSRVLSASSRVWGWLSAVFIAYVLGKEGVCSVPGTSLSRYESSASCRNPCRISPLLRTFHCFTSL